MQLAFPNYHVHFPAADTLVTGFPCPSLFKDERKCKLLMNLILTALILKVDACISLFSSRFYKN